MSLATPVAPAPAAEPPASSTPKVAAGNEVATLSSYEAGGKPYIVKLESADAAWGELDQQTQSDAQLISEYFHEKAKKGEYRTDDVAYRDFVRKFEHLTDTKSAPFSVKVKKISEFIRYLKRTA